MMISASSSSSVRGNHNSKTSLALKAVEEEFGSLKRQLERRERSRLGLPAAAASCNDSDVKNGDATIAALATPTNEHAEYHNTNEKSLNTIHSGSGSGGGRHRKVSDSDPPYPVPLFSGDDAALEVVKTAHRKHNRVIAAHAVQWTDGKAKVETLVAKTNEFRTELDGVITEAKDREARDPQILESGDCSSHCTQIRETIRQISALGSNIDPSDDSYNDFSFLKEDATLSTRERVLWQRLKDFVGKYKAAQTALTSASETIRSQQLDSDAALHDEREAHREAMETAKAEWTEERETLVSDVEHWQTSAVTLQNDVRSLKEVLATEREANKNQIATMENSHAAEINSWMQTVAAADREKHTLLQRQRELEQQLSGSSTHASELAEEKVHLTKELSSLRSAYAHLQSELARCTHALEASEQENRLLKAERPVMITVEAQVDNDTIVSDMKLSLEDSKREAFRNKSECETLRKKLQATSAELSAAEVLRKQFTTVQEEHRQTELELRDVTRRQQRDHRRRMELVCENYCLRSTIRILQRPNGFGERMEELTRENQWLSNRLEFLTKMRVVKKSTTSAGGEEDGTTQPSATSPTSTCGGGGVSKNRFLADRWDEEKIVPGVDRAFVTEIADAAVQCPGFTNVSSCASQKLVWKCVSTQVNEMSIAHDVDEVRARHRLQEHMLHSDGFRSLTTSAGGSGGVSKAIEFAEHRFRRSLKGEGMESDALHSDVLPNANSAPSAAIRPRSAMSNQSGISLDHTSASQTRNTMSKSRSLSASVNQQQRGGTSVVDDDGDVEEHPHGPSDSHRLMAEFLVVGHKDTPQSSALSGNPTQYYTLRRQSGLTGLKGVRKELDLHRQLDLASVEMDTLATDVLNPSMDPAARDGWLPTSLMGATTFPIRTMVRPTSASTSVGSSATAAAGTTTAAGGGGTKPQQRASSASHQQHTTSIPKHSLGTYMPATRSAVGAWKSKHQ